MSALKTWILFLVVAVFMVACSDDDSPTKVVLKEVESGNSKVDTSYVNEKGEIVTISGKDTVS